MRNPVNISVGLCSHDSGMDASASVSAEGMPTKQPGTPGPAVPSLTQAGLSSHCCRAD